MPKGQKSRESLGEDGQVAGLPFTAPQGSALASFLAAIVESSDAAIMTRDLSGRVVTWNHGAELIFGYSSHEILGKPLKILIPSELLPESEELLRRVMAGEQVEHYETVRLAKNGRRLDASVTMFLVKDHGENTIGVSKIIRDISRQKIAEESLRRSEARLRQAFSIGTVGIIFFKVDGAITGANDAFLRMSGYDREDLQKGLIRWDTQTPPEFMQQSRRAIGEFITEGRTTPYEKQYIRKDGSRWWALFSAARVSPQEGVEFVIDITRAKEAQEELRRQQELLKSMLQHLPVGVAMISGTDLTYELINEAYQNLAPGRVLLGKTVNEAWPEAKPMFGQLCREVLRTGKTFHGVDEPFRIPAPPGGPSALRYFSVNLARVALPAKEGWGLVLSVWETTRWKQGEAALRGSEERYRTLVSQVRDYAIFRTDTDGIPTSWNEGVKNVLGFAESDFVGKPIVEKIFSPEDITAGIPGSEMQKAIQTGAATIDRWMRRLDGSHFHASGITTALKDSSGSVLGFSTVMRDDTDRIEATQNLERTVDLRTADLSRTNEQLEAFVISVAHDLRSPLRGMAGFSDILLQRYAPKLDDRGRQMLSNIQISAQFMDRLLLDLLEYGRSASDPTTLTIVPLKAAWDSALFQCQAQIKRTDAAIETIEPLPGVRADRATLGQCLANLLSNALKFVLDGVTPRIRFWAEPRDGWCRMWLQDNGIGIQSDYHERIFKVFERLHGPQYPGTGIGLAIVKKGIERMGGKIGLESVEGHGTRFWIDLPRVD